jgi:hypothetical protein
MKSTHYLSRLEEIVSRDLDKLKRKAIFSDQGIYHVFDTYEIAPKGTVVEVTKKGQLVHEFGSLRSALGWCSADKLNKIVLSKNILDLDRQHQIAGADLLTRSHLAKKIRDPDRRDSAELKVAHRRLRIREIENELDKCIKLAKYWQIQGFHNETARTGRTASN